MYNKRMMDFNKKVIAIVVVALLATGSWSCKKEDNEAPEDKLDISNAYRNSSDADAAVIGIYGQFLGLHKTFILQNELRGDLMDVTANADQNLKALSNHTATKDNPYIDPRPYYTVILNCNDALKNFQLMVRDKKMSVDDYNKHYSDIGALRSYIYLQLGIQYGSIPYITDPVEKVDDVKNLSSFPRITFDQLLDKLIAFTEALPYKEVYAYPTGNPLVTTIDGSFTERMFISKPSILGDLYLWKNNYVKAAESYIKIFDYENTNPEFNKSFSWYKVVYTADQWADATVRYGRYQDEATLLFESGWRTMFTLPTTNRIWQAEFLWGIPYSSNFKPGNPMFELCSQQYGKYLVKPSQVIIESWNAQRQNSGIPYDARGRLSYSTSAAGPEITKFTGNTLPASAFNKGGTWGIYRATLLHLRYAEAANRDGKGKLGWALLNNGIINTFYNGTRNAAGAPAPVSFDDIASMRTPYAAPYFMDASSNTDFRGPWYRSTGIRGRAGITNLDVALQTDVLGLEGKLIDEGALETAFEGNRWPDLVRIATRENNPAFLADRVYQKLLKAGDPNAAATRTKLMNPANWYLPFDWK
ncbi:RagB/SusD family nutrient uptake outer membrane protein [Pedobacter frigiditerrae]|uniref:RagB/SusD family nutrient uptake outer membrane protein n=1 Tax=Pedobacter frigiditerrae TaxID=2530452 RepID=A0A4R0N015_9SPHI|nr:RagB/SusD family nutrient uptake outer membrane protein [Pedobacter frigiditerrae]TCC91752.1 RagB/SusD family nutrient uptake outer membrane protein [Pedobacter frigiditerrae]